ncbi:platelet binding protein GspB [Eurosta solidaginis]|uniref:platelet binding protein GspB n=1 Tax=Eurosta solidaginis TaxID=178769 RepID=UPI003530CE06
MSTRKATLATTTMATAIAAALHAAATATKTENVTPKGTTAAASVPIAKTALTNTILTNSDSATTTACSSEKAEVMESNPSVSFAADIETSEVAETVNTNTTTSNKDSLKIDNKRANSEPRRITRNSPLLLASPTASRKEFRNSEACDSELANSESEDGGGTRRSLQIKGRKSLKDCRDTKVSVEKDKTNEVDDNSVEINATDKSIKEVKAKETTEAAKETKSHKNKSENDDGAQIDNNGHMKATDTCDNATTTTVTATTTSATSTTNRLTRKSVAQELAANTRVTRNRRPETPPINSASTQSTNTSTRPRRSTVGKKPSATTCESTATKRKRVNDDESSTSGSQELLGSKCIKVEPKDEAEITEDELPPHTISITSNSDIDITKIKSEPGESDESATEASTSGTSMTRSRSRWTVRKPQQANMQSSPSTRATRQSKNASPSPSPTTSSASSASGSTTTESKRRRVNVQGNSLARSSSASTLLKTAVATGSANTAATSLHVPDEDSKDSMASSSIDDLSLIEIKMEKLTPDLGDELHITEAEEQPADDACSSITVPLTVNTDPEIIKEAKVAKTSTKSDEIKQAALVTEKESFAVATTSSNSSSATNEETVKAASLSPEMVSEGVSEISVKQFYKKPKFLENNLGIEEDPKLGGIVQQASTEKVTEQTTLDGDEQVVLNSADDATSISPIEKCIVNDESDALSVESEEIKEGDLRVDDSNEEKKTTNDDDANSVSTEVLSPLVIEEDEIVEADVGDDVEVVTEASNAKIIETDNDKEQNCKTIDVIDGEDDVTMEESETVSMDNNPSVHEDVMDDQQLDVDMETGGNEHLESKASMLDETDENVEDKNVEEINEKTKTECDSKQAKLKIENKVDEKNEIIKDENETKTLCLVNEDTMQRKYSEDKPVEMEIDDTECIDIAAAIDAIQSEEEEDEAKLCIDIQDEESTSANMEIIENIEDDEVVAKIDAELKKYDDLEKFKVVEKSAAVDNTKNIGDEKDNKDKEFIKNEDEVKEKEVKNEEEIKDKEEMKDKTKVKDKAEMKDKVEIKLSECLNSKPQNIEAVVSKKNESVASVGVDPNSKAAVDKPEDKATNSSDREDKEGMPASSTSSPVKSLATKEDDTTSMKSGQSGDSSSWVTLELENDEEALRQKEQHFQNLGLLTHKAAEKRRQEYIQSSAAAEATRAQQQTSSGNGGKRNGKSSSSSAVAHEYTGTLKTVIKINRNTSGSGCHTSASGVSNGRKNNGNASQHAATYGGSSASRDAGIGSTVRRQSLKMTFQKGRGRGQGHTDRTADQHSNVEDAYYTIQNENEGGLKAGNAGSSAEHTNVQTHGRKSYNRSNTTSHSTNTATIDSSHSDGYDTAHHHHHTNTSTSHKKDEKEEILIPEKASSFKFHPGRLCEDQCFYCSGKFGLYDTPCHVGQIKSAERQQKILANEEKLTVDSCLCDACFRHVDRRANVPSYKKRMSVTTNQIDSGATTATTSSTIVGSESIENTTAMEVEDNPRSHKCLVPDCANPAAHSLRRKCIRKSVKKFLLNFDMPTGSTCVWLCQAHYDTVIQCSGCVLCKRRLGKNHMYHITSDTDRLEKALSEMGIPVQLGIGTAVCKLCRYFANLLMKPPDSTKSQKAEFVKNYRKRLLQFHNIHDGSNDASEADDEDGNGTTVPDETAKASTCNSNKTQQKLDKSNLFISSEITPLKNLPSPADSNGSSIECLGEAAALEMSTNDSFDTKKQCQQIKQNTSLFTNDGMADFDAPVALSTDSNSSSAPMSPTNNGGKQMSKLKAILQSSSSSSQKTNASGSTRKSSSSSITAGGAGNNDISNVLRANPNISMRELFPGEEDLGLHFKVPFGSSSSQRTPEGWTRVQTFLQYDEATRRLWEDLQKPYGNQSSFLRHLILLEKYYRNGDLVLSPNASSNASVYTQTVRQRLTSYDQGHCGGLANAKPSPSTGKRSSTDIPTVEITEDDEEPKRTSSNENIVPRMEVDDAARDVNNPPRRKRARSDSVDKLTKQLSSNAVTIIARPKAQTAGDPSPQKSLLKEKSNENSVIPATTLTVVGVGNTAGNGANSNNSNSNSSSAAGNSRSILKTNLLGMNKAVEILPISASNSSATTNNNSTTASGKTQSISNNSGSSTTTSESKHQKILELANKLLDNRIEAAAAAAAADQTKSSNSSSTGTSILTSPPELVSLQRRAMGAASSSAYSTNTSNATTTPATSIPTVSPLTTSLINNKRTPHTTKTTNAPGQAANATVVVLPDTLTLRERQQRSWRPTLMPVEENLHLLTKDGPLYQTADGRRLPALVQVLSGGKPFLISIFDYNRMCILRREKLLRDQMLKTGKNPHEIKQQQQQQQQQPHSQHQQQQPPLKSGEAPNMHGTNFSKHASKQQHHHQQQQQHQSQQHQQHQHQNQQQQNQNQQRMQHLQQQHQKTQQELMHLQQMQQMMQMQKQAAHKATSRYQPIAPKATPTATAHNGGGTNSGSSMNTSATTLASPVVNNVNVPNSNNNSVFTSPMLPLLANAFANPNPNPLAVAAAAAAATAKLNSNAWIWNFPNESNHLINGNMPTHTQGPPKLPQLLHKGPPIGSGVGGSGNIAATITSKQQQQHQQHQQMLIDNTLMSKIPKTLTVIPQHKLMGSNSTNSNATVNMSHKE